SLRYRNVSRNTARLSTPGPLRLGAIMRPACDLVRHAYKVFRPGEDRLPTREILHRIAVDNNLDPASLTYQGKQLTPKMFANAARSIDCSLEPRVMRFGGRLARGYLRRGFEHAYVVLR